MEKLLARLCASASLLNDESHSYFSGQLSRPETFDDTWVRCGSLLHKMTGKPPTTAKPIRADRLSFPGPPLFDPLRYMDAATAELYLRPVDNALDYETYDGPVPLVNVNANEKEKMALFRKLRACGRLELADPARLRPPFFSGLFSVGKNS